MKTRKDISNLCFVKIVSHKISNDYYKYYFKDNYKILLIYDDKIKYIALNKSGTIF